MAKHGVRLGFPGETRNVDPFPQPSTPIDGDVLTWVAADGQWEASTPFLTGLQALGLTATLAELNGSDLSAYPVARTATAAGLTTGTIADGGVLTFVTVTSDSADKIIILPTPSPGAIVILVNGATGYELRSSAPATVAINGGAEADAESAIAASTLVIAICKSATAWAAFSLAGTTLAAVEAAAAA